MSAERYVVLGLAHVRSPWFREVARWCTGAVLPVEFVKTVSVEEVRARLASGRGFSALLIGDDVAGLDRDLVDEARSAGCAVVVVGGGRGGHDWSALDVSAVLPASFGRSELVEVLSEVAVPIARTRATDPVAVERRPVAWRGRLVAVTGPGGAGSSTVATGLAQGLASDPRLTDLVCLADLVRRADLGMLHDVDDVVPSLVELVDAHRTGLPRPDEVRALTWEIVDRGYRLLLGLRRAREWTAVRPRAFDAALDGLLRSFRVVVADVDDDVEGEDTSGSIDVEERNVMARTCVLRADVVVAVGMPGVKGIHSLVRSLVDLVALGVDTARLVPVLNGAPRSPRQRAELTEALGVLTRGMAPAIPSPVFVPHRKAVEQAFRDGERLPDAVVTPVARPVSGLLASLEERPVASPEPVAVVPGSLGSWTAEEPA